MEVTTRDHPVSVTRDDLYVLVWSSPMAVVAAKLEVSGSYLARVCKALNVPRPLPGHWAKLAAGKTSPLRCALPRARPGDPQVWQRGEWPPKVARVDPVAPDPRVRRRGLPNGPLPGSHPLLAGMKEALDSSRQSYYADYQKPRTGKLVDVVVSKSGTEAALKLANQVYLTLEARGHRVVLAPRGIGVSRAEFDEREKPGPRQCVPDLWAPSRLTTAYVGSVPFGLTIVELSERVEVQYVDGEYVRLTDLTPAQRRVNWPDGWRQMKEMPSGRFMLLAYCPEQAAGWTEAWRESREGELLKKIPAIVRRLETAAPEVAQAMRVGREREVKRKEAQEAAHAQWLVDDERRRLATARKQSKSELLEVIRVWAEYRDMLEFLSKAEAEVSCSTLAEHERIQLLDRLGRARELVSEDTPMRMLSAWRSPAECLTGTVGDLASLARQSSGGNSGRQ